MRSNFDNILKIVCSALIHLCMLYFILTLMPALVCGQSYQSFRSRQKRILETKYNIGPFKIFPSLYFNNVGYDSNVYRMREGDDPISDFTATLSPQIRAYLLYNDWLILSVSENPQYVFYREQKQLAGWNNIFSSKNSP